MILKTNTSTLPQIIVYDVMALTVIYFVPTISHWLSFPLFLIDPMRILLFLGYLYTNNKYNTFLLAATIPLISTLFGGHPPFFKSVLISFELITNISLFVLVTKRLKMETFTGMLLTIILSKCLYYFAKYIFITVGLLPGPLVTTGLKDQFIAAVALSCLFKVLFYIKNKKS